MTEFKDVRIRRQFDEDSSGRDSLDTRSSFERDYGRLIHSPTFRRLQGKSQVFGAGSGDYYRTRLTHSLEVAQIARSIANKLKDDPVLKKNDEPGLTIDPLVVECAALAHDIGHPPFGHKGEHDLNEKLKDYNLFFEGNAQNFRLLMHLEKRSANYNGLNLTAATLLAINKYPYELKRDSLKGLYDSEWSTISSIRKEWNMPNTKATIEAQLMDLSDDIAYSSHDIEDGIRAGKIQMTETFLLSERLIKYVTNEVADSKKKDPKIWENVDIDSEVNSTVKEFLGDWEKTYEKLGKNDSLTRKENKASSVNNFIKQVGIIEEDNWFKVTFVNGNNSEDTKLKRKMIILKKLAWVTLVKDLRVQRLQQRGENIINKLWEAFFYNGKSIIPSSWLDGLDDVDCKKEDPKWLRFIADYISGMTDSYAEKLYQELYGSLAGSIYDLD
ncbi:deoxyguanosinetriphosphate triphosphohydrolase family protein [Paenibacillus hunanensis]|uniref:Deoxyguanosinetriphosphate triphosphohydrolase-like protein n=1 Tax=Paenibacillus hunanensis TaxID=539262 RepID=A0ABU1IX32_9BACL|nr:dNTP triphosphohydrolase [Paenibacillus hunanensis]MDR6243481.1 dGTPase [Paenibacillus hunanensis]GGI98073.1 deoxyguanosinetriphosphate triphosphohydrolase [Paenibacillus hunanensis]